MPLPRQQSFATLPDPAEAGSIDDLTKQLRMLKVWGGDPSYATIKDRVNAAWSAAGRPASEMTKRSTVAHCFQHGRKRLNTDLTIAIVEALHPDSGYVTQWRQALRAIAGEIEAVSKVRVQGSLPPELAGFTGRTGEFERLRHAARAGQAVVISAIEGMAGVGKTQLAVHAAHQLMREEAFERVLFVNLRGFHPDPAQPPADPGAVLDGFLRLLGMPGDRIPHDLTARTAAYRDRLAGSRTLIVLDNAATVEQVRPLLPAAPGCLALVTSRRDLTGLHPTTRLVVDVFTPGEAVTFLTSALPEMPAGADPAAAGRIAQRCGHLPLALSLIAGHLRNTPDWTLTDHADRLDERHHTQRMDSGVEHAFTLSYQHLAALQQRLLRLTALHPGPDFDVYAAAALTDADPATTRDRLIELCRDHLLQPATAGRYTFHDLVRAYATGRAHDHDRPPARRAALTRLFDYYLATAAAAMNTLRPAEAHDRPRVPPAGTPAPDLADPDTALAWLDTERATLVTVVAHTATHGWHRHTTGLAGTLFRYLGSTYYTDAVTVHGHAHQAARADGDHAGQARALVDLGFARLRLGQPGPAVDHFRQALDLYRQTGDLAGQARALHDLGMSATWTCRFAQAVDYSRQALTLYRQAGDRAGEARVLNSLGYALERSGRLAEALDYVQQALTLARQAGARPSEAQAVALLGDLEMRLGRYEPARDHLHQALVLYRQAGSRNNEAGALDSLGELHTRLGQPLTATAYHQQALAVFREVGNRGGEAVAFNGLGEAAQAAGQTADALAHHTTAHAHASAIDAPDQLARAHAGLGHVHHTLGNHAQSRQHHHQALILYTDLGLPQADQIRAHLTNLKAGD